MATKQRYWKKHIEAWRNSGITQAAYCREHGLPIKAFGYHKRRIVFEPEKQQIVPVLAVAKPLVRNETDARSIEMRVRDKFTLVIEPNFCQQTLKRLLDVIDA